MDMKPAGSLNIRTLIVGIIGIVADRGNRIWDTLYYDAAGSLR